jgi:hypothetical protein
MRFGLIQAIVALSPLVLSGAAPALADEELPITITAESPTLEMVDGDSTVSLTLDAPVDTVHHTTTGSRHWSPFVIVLPKDPSETKLWSVQLGDTLARIVIEVDDNHADIAVATPTRITLEDAKVVSLRRKPGADTHEIEEIHFTFGKITVEPSTHGT